MHGVSVYGVLHTIYKKKKTVIWKSRDRDTTLLEPFSAMYGISFVQRWK